jgi:sugar-specific transcriptional regulator TrmB
MANERLKKRLIDLGIEEKEAEIYVFISAMGPTPARLVARRFSLNRMRVYRSLKSLEEKGLANKVMGRPVKFVATPLKNVLDRQIGGLKQTLIELEENEESLIREWENLSRGAAQPLEEPKFRIFQGREQVFDLLFDMFDRAQDTIRLVTTTSDLTRLSLGGLDDKLREMKRLGKGIKVLTQIDTKSLEEVQSYNEFVNVRHISLQTPIRVAIIDGREALNTVAMDDSMSMTTQADTGLWTDASNYVAAQMIFFDALWSLAPDAESVMQSIKTGEPPHEIRTYTTQDEYASVFREMIVRAKEKIDIMAKNVAASPATLAEFIALADKDVKIRMLTQTDSDNLPEIEKMADSKITIAENATVTDIVLLTIDEKEALMNIPYIGTQKRIVWSNIDAFVGTMILVFDDYWDLGKPIQEKLLQVAQRKKMEYVAQRLKDEFEEMGWTAEIPGTIAGLSWKTYMFDILAKSPERTKATLCIDILTEGSVFNKIIERSIVQSDLTSSNLILASLIPYKSEELKLAELYRIQIVHSQTEEELVSEILKTVKKIEKKCFVDLTEAFR